MGQRRPGQANVILDRSSLLIQGRVFHIIDPKERFAHLKGFWFRVRLSKTVEAIVPYRDVRYHCELVDRKPTIRRRTAWERLLED